ncbi:hypothetical protein M6D93_15815 [Jatrophihabitans telluris]|uniref:DUF6542 domain-containing protein n=1 Tax=Jatrophihabitans telluris TaxID=2038343 RepID=A0ABY4QVV4_9ACTN|nr:DUF6542 domain-containing protein [Jatrophihabitans telluris]UQX87754.1 hypothetical protein M6D93_15815 [Jatrophihabitans telluris]
MSGTSSASEYDKYARYRSSATPRNGDWSEPTVAQRRAAPGTGYDSVHPQTGHPARPESEPSPDRAGRLGDPRREGQQGKQGQQGGGPGRSTDRGVPGWAAVLVLIVIAGIGGLIDQISGASIQGAFNWALIVASLIAILIVRRGQMFPVVIAPPLVYFIASAAKLYISSNGLKSRGALIDAASNWLVYGFPAIAAATAIVLLIAGIRMLARR